MLIYLPLVSNLLFITQTRLNLKVTPFETCSLFQLGTHPEGIYYILSKADGSFAKNVE